MKEQLISFETAKLAEDTEVELKLFGRGYEYTDEDGNEYWTALPKGISGKENTRRAIVCTQSLLQKYLREKFDVWVIVDFAYETNKLSAYVQKSDREPLIDGFTMWDTYEQALEEGLQEALKII